MEHERGGSLRALGTFLIQALHDARFGLPLGELLEDAYGDGCLAGLDGHFIEHQLAHAVRDPLGRAYNRTSHLAERKNMMQRWADYQDGLKRGAQVVPVNRAPREVG